MCISQLWYRILGKYTCAGKIEEDVQGEVSSVEDKNIENSFKSFLQLIIAKLRGGN